MKTKLLIIIILSVQIKVSFSQELFNCGTPDISIEEAQKLPWYGNRLFLSNYVDSLYLARNLDKDVENDVARIPVKFWVYRKSDGTPGGTDRLPTDVDYQNMMDELNNAFRNNNVPIRFYMMHSIGYVDNDDYLDISTTRAFVIGILHKHPKSLNIHIVNNLTDAGGVAWFAPEANRNVFIPRYVYSFKQGNNLSTVPHEVGHYFSLLHTFQSTEWNIPCLREPVNRWVWTLCPGGLWPIYQNRCLYTGDYLCDTPADPNMQNGSTNGSCEWTCSTKCKDSYGKYYNPDVHNIMAYGNGGCESHFSSGQRNIMTYAASMSPNSGFWLPYLANNFDTYEPDNTANTARPIEIGETQIHSFHNSDYHLISVMDDDWVHFTVGSTYENSVLEISTSANGAVKPDTKITLYKQDFNGNLQYIAYDDDSNGNEFSKIELSNVEQGNYFIKIEVNNQLGKYNLKVISCIPENVCLSETIISGETKKVAAVNKVTLPCNNNNLFIVQFGAVVTIKSKNKIDLNPGFETETGATFTE